MSNATDELKNLIDSAERLGIELDEAEALQWLSHMAAWDHTDDQSDIVIDPKSGVYGHTVSMLDFSPADLAYFRAMGNIVAFDDESGIETALALSGSAAQSKIQTYPGDADFFERINIHAPTRADACQTLGRIMREKALATASGPSYQFHDCRLGSYPQTAVRDGVVHKAGASIVWRPADVRAGEIALTTPEGEPFAVRWEDAAAEPGWCKMDWVVADPVRKRLANASNMLDVTWEAPNGAITPLDGYLDGYFQEVYLEAESIPIFSKLVKHVSADALGEYLGQLEKEVCKYVGDPPNYGKAAKRMYNVFRLNGRYAEAAYLRELFDEPTTALYQGGALIRTIDDALQPGSTISVDTLLDQTDELIVRVVSVLEGDQETEIVRLLLRMRDALANRDDDKATWKAEVIRSRAAVINVVNNFFHEKLTAMPSIASYIEQMQDAETGA